MQTTTRGLHSFLAEISAESYERQTFGVAEVEGLVARSVTRYGKRTQIIAIRGTEFTGAWDNGGLVDIARDLFVIPKRIKGVGIGHAGFLRGARDVAGLLHDSLDKHSPVICTGHSMGAAVSMALAQCLLNYGFKVVEWVGFGTPRVFTKRLHWGNTKVTHYQYGKDIVPIMLPPGLVYEHQAQPVIVGEASSWLPNLTDHDVKKYVEAV